MVQKQLIIDIIVNIYVFLVLFGHFWAKKHFSISGLWYVGQQKYWKSIF